MSLPTPTGNTSTQTLTPKLSSTGSTSFTVPPNTQIYVAGIGDGLYSQQIKVQDPNNPSQTLTMSTSGSSVGGAILKNAQVFTTKSGNVQVSISNDQGKGQWTASALTSTLIAGFENTLNVAVIGSDDGGGSVDYNDCIAFLTWPVN